MRKFIFGAILVVGLTAIVCSGKVTGAKTRVKKPTITVKKKKTTSVQLAVKSSNKKLSGYKLYKKVGKKYKKIKTIKVKSGKKKVSYTVKKLKANTKYKFKVTAYRKYKGKMYFASKTKTVKTLNSRSSTNNSSNTGKKDVNDPDDSIVAPESGWEQKMLDKVNELRRKEGVGELVLNQDLCNIALIRCKALYYEKINSAHEYSWEYFAAYYKNKGIEHYYSCSENAAWGQLSWGEALQDWVDSSGHYSTMMTETFTDFGVACYNGIWYQAFENRNRLLTFDRYIDLTKFDEVCITVKSLM